MKSLAYPQYIWMVGKDMASLGLHVHRVAREQADVSTLDGTAPNWAAIRLSLQEAGFELLGDLHDQLVDCIKTLLVALTHYPLLSPRLLSLPQRAPGQGLLLSFPLVPRFLRPLD